MDAQRFAGETTFHALKLWLQKIRFKTSNRREPRRRRPQSFYEFLGRDKTYAKVSAYLNFRLKSYSVEITVNKLIFRNFSIFVPFLTFVYFFHARNNTEQNTQPFMSLWVSWSWVRIEIPQLKLTIYRTFYCNFDHVFQSIGVSKSALKPKRNLDPWILKV